MGIKHKRITQIAMFTSESTDQDHTVALELTVNGWMAQLDENCDIENVATTHMTYGSHCHAHLVTVTYTKVVKA